jgi:hypothetical protein
MSQVWGGRFHCYFWEGTSLRLRVQTSIRGLLSEHRRIMWPGSEAAHSVPSGSLGRCLHRICHKRIQSAVFNYTETTSLQIRFEVSRQ